MGRTVADRFRDLIHRSVTHGISRAIQAESFANEIADRRSWINNTGLGQAFRALQVTLADELVLSVTRMFDEPHKKHQTQSIPAVLGFMEEKARWLPVLDRGPVERELIRAGGQPSQIKQLPDVELTRRIAAHYTALLPDPNNWRTDPVAVSLRALRHRRNKKIAHTQTVAPRSRVDAAWDDARILVAWALNFGDGIGPAYINYHYLASDKKTYLSDKFVREPGREFGKVLDRAGLRKGRYHRRRTT